MTIDPHMKHLAFDNLPRAVVVMENVWPSGRSTGWHSHSRGQLLYATEGVMVVHTDAGSWVVPPNRALWMVAGLRHTVSMSGRVVMRTAYIDTSRVRTMPARSGVINVSPLLRELLVEAAQLIPHAEPSGRDAHLLALLVDEIKGSQSVALHLPMPQDARLAALCQRLMAHPADPASATGWAARAGMAERTLHRLFTRDTGMTFAQWRDQARLLHALRRIAEGSKVIDVALDCGYASPSAFSAMFKRHFGVAPSSFYR